MKKIFFMHLVSKCDEFTASIVDAKTLNAFEVVYVRYVDEFFTYQERDLYICSCKKEMVLVLNEKRNNIVKCLNG